MFGLFRSHFRRYAERVALAAMAIIAALSASAAQAADDPRLSAPTGLVLTYHAAPADRPALRRIMLGDGVALLERWRAEHRIAHYRLLWQRYPDAQGFDMMLVLNFDRPAGVAGWRTVEEQLPGGLPQAAQPLVRSIDSVPMSIMHSADGAIAGKAPQVYLVVPYQYVVGVNDYLKYVDGYVLPQLDGWLAGGALGHYDTLISRFPAGRPWNAMLLLGYQGDEGLGRRDAVVASVRARLNVDPAWHALSESKDKIREERIAEVADVLAAQ